MPKIIIYRKNVYGVEHTYISEEHAENGPFPQAIRILTGQKTLSNRHKEALEALGFTFEEVK